MDDELIGLEKRDLLALNNLSRIDELVEMCDFVDDQEMREIIDLSLKCYAQPHMKPETAEQLLVKFQAAATKFGFLAVTYTTLRKGKAGTEDNYKKNIYYTASDLCDKMAASLKYIVRRSNASA